MSRTWRAGDGGWGRGQRTKLQGRNLEMMVPGHPWPRPEVKQEVGEAKRGSEGWPCHPNRALSRLTCTPWGIRVLSPGVSPHSPWRGLSILQPSHSVLGKSIQPLAKAWPVTCSGHRTRVASSPLKLNETQFLPLSCHKNSICPTKGMLLSPQMKT